MHLSTDRPVSFQDQAAFSEALTTDAPDPSLGSIYKTYDLTTQFSQMYLLLWKAMDQVILSRRPSKEVTQHAMRHGGMNFLSPFQRFQRQHSRIYLTIQSQP